MTEAQKIHWKTTIDSLKAEATRAALKLAAIVSKATYLGELLEDEADE